MKYRVYVEEEHEDGMLVLADKIIEVEKPGDISIAAAKYCHEIMQIFDLKDVWWTCEEVK